ncbi:MAG: 6-phosphogluconolactonase [Gammaproteobacteria bacterium]|nr:6-phosphogluconolactonase [Gammaproteobacteria bacterium]
MEIKKYSELQALNQAAADLFLSLARQAVARQGAFHVALAGGSTPQALYELLAMPEYAEVIPWDNVYIYFGDERSVLPDDDESNYGMACEALLNHVPIPEAHIHRIEAECSDVHHAAAAYEELLRTCLPSDEHGQVEFDLILLGIGPDGHTASLFPKTDILHETKALVGAVYVKEKQTWRVSLTFPVLNQARQLLFLVAGHNKAEIIGQILGGAMNKTVYPVQQIKSQRQLWLIDQAAAERL